VAFFFFFQAEDGIRYRNVTGVQTCALPISGALIAGRGFCPQLSCTTTTGDKSPFLRLKLRLCLPRRKIRATTLICRTVSPSESRSEERRVGKGCRSQRDAEAV